MEDLLSRVKKNRITSEPARKKGNEFFKNRDFEQAIDFYTISLCHAPPGSNHIPLAYGNRSAVYCEMGKYALAIENIKLARESGYPAAKMSQLDDREKRCRKLMKEFGPDSSFDASTFFKLSHPPNEKIPFIAGCLELHRNEKYGRYVVTTKDLKTGDIIAIEKPAYSWVDPCMPTPSCFVCTKSRNGSLIPCSRCALVLYCSKECQEEEALFHHNKKFGGQYLGNFRKSLKMQLEAFRIAGGVDELFELLKDSEGKTIFDFDFSNPDNPSYDKNILIALNGLWRKIGSQDMAGIDEDQLLNVPPINLKKRAAPERNKLLKFIISQSEICSSNLLQMRGGLFGIFLLQSLLNHSCLPNVESFTFDTDSVLMITRPIKAGEQLFMSYVANAAVHSTKKRRHILQHHQIRCDCKACINDWAPPFRRKDGDFVHPKSLPLKPEEAIEQFKKNCKYIDKHAGKMPCYEVQKLIDDNFSLTCSISKNKINK